MATATISAELAVVYIVSTVAISAGPVVANHPDQRAAVTLRAADAGMRALQCKVRLSIVIKQPVFPGHRVMAAFTVAIKIAAVRIIVAVTSNAVRLGIAKRLGLVAIRTFVFGMVTQQRHVCQIVIKKDRVLPVDFSVATLTLVSQRRFVWLVICVT